MIPKQVQTSTGTTNLYLSIFLQLKQGARPSKICSNLSIKKQKLQYYLSSLKRAGFIKKIGYGTWEILKNFDQKEVQTTTGVANINRHNLYLFKEDKVRGHAFQFVLKIPYRLKNWKKREEIFGKKGIKFEKLNLGKIDAGQKIEFKGRKIWLTDKSIIIYEKSSYLADTSKESKQHAIYDFLSIIKGIENLLGANFSIRGQYQFRVSRQHYSLIKNALAKQYDAEGKKLQVYNESGLWFIIDNSYNLHEAETLHPKTADIDNKKVQDFFNGIKKFEGFTPQFVINSIGQNATNLNSYAVHLKAHVESVKTLGEQTKNLVFQISELTEVIKEIKGSKNE